MIAIDTISIEIAVEMAKLNAAMAMAEQRVALAARRMDRDMRLTVLPASTGLLQVHGGAAAAFGGFLSASQLQAMREHQAMVKNVAAVTQQMNQPMNDRSMLAQMFLGGQGFAKAAAGMHMVRGAAEAFAEATGVGLSKMERVEKTVSTAAAMLTFGVSTKLQIGMDNLTGDAELIAKHMARAERSVAKINSEMELLKQRRASRFDLAVAQAGDPMQRAMAEAAQRQGEIRMERQELFHKGIVSPDFEETARNREWMGRAESVRSIYGPVPSRYIEHLWQQMARHTSNIGAP